MRLIKHGEVLFIEVENIPSAAKDINAKGGYVVGESETHGNSHNVMVNEVTRLMTDEDKLFIATLGTEIYCPNKTRHDTITLPAGKWQVGHAQEFDYFSESLRRVRD